MSHYEIDAPNPWTPIEGLCYPRNGSKAYKHPSGANAHLIQMKKSQPSGCIAQLEDEEGEFSERKWLTYSAAKRVLEEWMGDYE